MQRNARLLLRSPLFLAMTLALLLALVAACGGEEAAPACNRGSRKHRSPCRHGHAGAHGNCAAHCDHCSSRSGTHRGPATTDAPHPLWRRNQPRQLLRPKPRNPRNRRQRPRLLSRNQQPPRNRPRSRLPRCHRRPCRRARVTGAGPSETALLNSMEPRSG